MSRSGYGGEGDDVSLWRQAVNNAINGKRGQLFLQELLMSLDAMPNKRLIAHDLECDGEVCALGSVGKMRHIDMTHINPEDYHIVARMFGIAECLAQEIVFINDEAAPPKWDNTEDETPEERFQRVRKWVASKIKTKEGAQL